MGLKNLVLLSVLVGSAAFAPVAKPFGAKSMLLSTPQKDPATADALDPDCAPEDEYCIVDEKSGKLIRLTIEEKERIFLDALQAYYATGRQVMPDEEFDLLKEDLQWNGSDVIQMNRKEAKYLAAVQAYLKGEPMLSDTEFDSLKSELKEAGSKFASSKEPKCLIETGICSVTMQEDNFRGNLLYLPAASLIVSLWLGVAFEVVATVIRFNPLIFTILGTPLYWFGAKFITEDLLFPNKKVVYGPCPSCEAENRIYFGDMLGIEGHGDVANVKCNKCKTQFQVQKDTLRASTVPKN